MFPGLRGTFPGLRGMLLQQGHPWMLVILGAVIALILTGIVVYLLWPTPDDAWKERMRELETEAAILIAEAARLKEDVEEARLGLMDAELRRAEERARYDSEIARSNAVIAGLRQNITNLETQITESDTVDYAHPELSDIEFAGLATSTLASAASHVDIDGVVDPTPIVTAHNEPGLFTANRSALSISLRATTQLPMYIALSNNLRSHISELEYQLDLSHKEIEAGDTLYQACSSAMDKCFAALEAREAAYENAEKRNEALRARVKYLEGKAFRNKIIFGALAIGAFELGRRIQ